MIIDKLMFKVMGYKKVTVTKEDKEYIYTQLQNIVSINGVIKKNTLRVNEDLNEKQCEDILNKTIEVTKEQGLQEYGDFDKSYVCNEYSISKEELPQDKVIENSLTIKLSNYKINKEKNETLVQYIDTTDNNIRVLNIKIKELVFDFSKYINETFIIKDINSFNDKKNKKTYYSTTTRPQHIKG